MREAPLLPFNHMNISHHTPKHTMLHQIPHQCIQLELEHTLNNVRPVTGRLPWQQLSRHLWPLGVACDSNKQIRLAMLLHQSHGILI
jgi:hypothetical protein